VEARVDEERELVEPSSYEPELQDSVQT